MSMNIYLRAEILGEAVILGEKKSKTFYEDFSCAQTPTAVTKQILQSDDKQLAYSNWVRERERLGWRRG